MQYLLRFKTPISSGIDQIGGKTIDNLVFPIFIFELNLLYLQLVALNLYDHLSLELVAEVVVVAELVTMDAVLAFQLCLHFFSFSSHYLAFQFSFVPFTEALILADL